MSSFRLRGRWFVSVLVVASMITTVLPFRAEGQQFSAEPIEGSNLTPDEQLWNLTLEELGSVIPSGATLTFTNGADGLQPELSAEIPEALLIHNSGVCVWDPLAYLIPEDLCEEGHACGGITPRPTPSPVPTLTSPFAAVAARAAPPPRAPIAFQAYQINTPQKDRYEKGIYIYLKKGEKLSIYDLTPAGNPGKLLSQLDPSPSTNQSVELPWYFVYPKAPPADVNHVPPANGPAPYERYRFASVVGMPGTRIFAVKSSTGAIAYLKVGPGVLQPVPKPTVGPPPPTAGDVPLTGKPIFKPVKVFPYSPPARVKNYMNLSPTLNAIMIHADRKLDTYNDPGTIGHETNHMLNAWGQRTYAFSHPEYAYKSGNTTMYPATGMYFPGKGIAIVKGMPEVWFREIRALLPDSLLTPMRDKTYFQGKDEERRLNGKHVDVIGLLDEANAYTNEAVLVLDLHDVYYRKNCSAVTQGAGEFIAIALAVEMFATQNKAKAYGANAAHLKQLHEAVKLNCEIARDAFRRSLDVKRYPGFHLQGAGGKDPGLRMDFLTTIRTDNSERGKALRKFIISAYGQAWFDAMFR